MTSKLQLTIPKAVAEKYKIRPGDQVDWIPAGDVIRVVPAGRQESVRDRGERLGLFDRATERQRYRQARRHKAKAASDRGWKREELYTRGRAR